MISSIECSFNYCYSREKNYCGTQNVLYRLKYDINYELEIDIEQERLIKLDLILQHVMYGKKVKSKIGAVLGTEKKIFGAFYNKLK